MIDIKVEDFGFFEATTGNGKEEKGEWSHHFISGLYEVTRIEETKIFLKDDKIEFPVMKERITKFEKKPKK
jgi:hypothetical protein